MSQSLASNSMVLLHNPGLINTDLILTNLLSELILCNMYKILMIVPSPFFADRGCHVRILEEAKALKERGNHVCICTYPLGRNIDGFDIRRTLPVPWYRKLSAGPSIHKFYLDLLLYLTVRKCLKKEHFDVIHAHLHEGIYIAEKLRKKAPPILADLQGSMTDEVKSHGFLKNQAWILKQFRRIEKRLNHIPQKIILSSKQTYELFHNQFDIPKEKMQVISDGVDCNIFQPSLEKKTAIREKLQLPIGKKIVAFLGLLTQYQGLEILLNCIPKVIKQYDNVHFLLMGYPNETRWRERFAQHGLGNNHVTFTGKIPYEEAHLYLNAGDLAVSPKFSKTEANGKLLNYMAHGLPTIVFDSEINREILSELGIYADYGNADSFADCIIQTLKSDPIALGKKLRERALKHFSWEAQAKKIEACYNEIT